MLGKVLTEKGFTKDRISSSHHQWKRKGYRTIPVWGNEKEIPPHHLKTGCFTIGCTLQ
ncbi:MAG: type II toxin-antitoxin system HicA family toxin [Bacteroidia bacterium]